MKILLTNDDGVFARGIWELANALKSKHDVIISAPDSNRSGAAHSFTLTMPLRCSEVMLNGLENVKAYSVSGTPVDCVKLACGNLGIAPDLIISGINHGENRGTDVFYSGTVSAAVEGALLGIPSIAASNVCCTDPKHLKASAVIASEIVDTLEKNGIEKTLLLNINIPDKEAEDIKGVKVTSLSFQEYEQTYDERLDTRNMRYYWIPAGRLTKCLGSEDNDERWVNEGYVSITPLKTDLTDYERIEKYRAVFRKGDDKE